MTGGRPVISITSIEIEYFLEVLRDTLVVRGVVTLPSIDRVHKTR